MLSAQDIFFVFPIAHLDFMIDTLYMSGNRFFPHMRGTTNG